MMKTISKWSFAEPQENVNAGRISSRTRHPNKSRPRRSPLGKRRMRSLPALGQPQKRVNLGAKEIYIYPDMKVTFMNGKVSMFNDALLISIRPFAFNTLAPYNPPNPR